MRARKKPVEVDFEVYRRGLEDGWDRLRNIPTFL